MKENAMSSEYGFLYLQKEQRRLANLATTDPEQLPHELASMVLDSPRTNEQWLHEKGVQAGAGENLSLSVTALAFSSATVSPGVARSFLSSLDDREPEIRERLQLDPTNTEIMRSGQQSTLSPLARLSQRVGTTAGVDPEGRAIVQTWLTDKQQQKERDIKTIIHERAEKDMGRREAEPQLLAIPSLQSFWPAFGTFVKEYDLTSFNALLLYHKYRNTRLEKLVEERQEKNIVETNRELTPEEQLPKSCQSIAIRLPKAVLSYPTLDAALDHWQSYVYPEIPESAEVPIAIAEAIRDNNGERATFDNRSTAIRNAGRSPVSTRDKSALSIYPMDDHYNLELVRRDEPHRVGWGEPNTEEFAQMMGVEDRLTYEDDYYHNPRVTYEIGRHLSVASNPSDPQMETLVHPKELATHFAQLAGLTPDETVLLAEHIVASCGRRELKPGELPAHFQAENGMSYSIEPNPRLTNLIYDQEKDCMMQPTVDPLASADITIVIAGGTPSSLHDLTKTIAAIQQTRKSY